MTHWNWAAQVAGEHIKSFAYTWDWVVCAKFPLLLAREAKKVGNCCSTMKMGSDPLSRFAASKIGKCMQGFHTVDE